MTNRNECRHEAYDKTSSKMSIWMGECIQCPFARRLEHTNTRKPHRLVEYNERFVLSLSEQIWRSRFFNGATSSRLKHAYRKREQGKRKKKFFFCSIH